VVAAGVVLAIAAAALLVVRVGPSPVADEPDPAVPDGFDVAIDELDLELTSLELELL
jgi:hypothetical protein